VYAFLKIDKDIFRQLMSIAYPMVISQGAFALMIFTDRYFMSLVSPTHMGAALGGGVASFFTMSLFFGVLSYGNALVAQYFGAGHLEKCPRVLTQGLILCLGFMPLLLLISYFVGDLFAFMGHVPVMVALEQEYYYILIWGAVVSLVKACFGSYFAGIGETRVVMIADTLAVALNIPLTYMLIFGVGGLPALGIAGAAWATIISTLLGVGLFLAFYLAAEHRQRFFLATSLVLDRGIMHRYLRLGLPSGIEMFLNVAAFNLFMLMFQSYGIVEAAAASIVLNWDIVSFIPMIGLNVALISLVGRYIGEGNFGKVRQVIICGFVAGFGYSGLLALLFALQRDSLVQVFLNGNSEDAAILALASPMMLGLATYAMADAILLVVGGVLRGAGDTRWMMWMSVTLHWLMLLAQYLVIKVFEFTPLVSWSVFVLMILVTAGIYLWRIQGQAWRSPEAIAKVMAEH
jgi:MATE family multidrug resistance protein